jgi:glycosyltransferase involved in cell wall biosynthesis
MAPTATIAAELRRRGFSRVRIWTRGVDHGRFYPRASGKLDLKRPIFLSVGRLAVEKNLEVMLKLDLPGSLVVVGDGPARAHLQSRFPRACFLGEKRGEALAEIYACADVFVFPSRTDTFGNVILEALASGLPIAAFPVPGPVDIIGNSGAGVLDEDLRAACLKALSIPREAARARSLDFTWKESARQFLANIYVARMSGGHGAAEPRIKLRGESQNI